MKQSVTQDSTKREYIQCLYSAMSGQDTHKALRHWSHSFACKLHHTCLCFASVHQMAPLLSEVEGIWWGLLLIYRPRRDGKLSWPGWLTYSGWFAHISGYPSATGRALDREVHRWKDRRSTVIPRNQPTHKINDECEPLTGRGVVHSFIQKFLCLLCFLRPLMITELSSGNGNWKYKARLR